MAKRTAKGSQAKRPPGRPRTGRGILIGVRCQPDFIKEIDAWREAQPVPPSRPQAIVHHAATSLARRRNR